jgi:DNA-binding NarL/FixJ family response regulator
MTIRVFLADDHTVVRDGLRFLLEAAGDIVVVGDAADGRQAARQIAQLKPDVALIDITMPEMNGVEATRVLRMSAPETRVIILSMHSTVEHIHGAMQAGARGYLLKDSAGLEVVAAVRAVQRGERYLSQKITQTLIDDYVQLGEQRNPLSQLTAREREVMQLVVEGHSSSEIARRLSISTKTVETYRSRVMQKLQLNDLASLVKFAIQHGLIGLD